MFSQRTLEAPPYRMKGVLSQLTSGIFTKWEEKLFILTDISVHSIQRLKPTSNKYISGMFTVSDLSQIII